MVAEFNDGVEHRVEAVRGSALSHTYPHGMGAPSAGATVAVLILIFITSGHRVYASDLNTDSSEKSSDNDSLTTGGVRSEDSAVDTTEDSVAASDDRDASLTVPYSPTSEVESDPQPSSDRSARADEDDEENADTRKGFFSNVVPKLQLAFSPDDGPLTSATYYRRQVTENELIHLKRIPGASELIRCSGEGEFYSVMTPWKQCMVCVCVGASLPQPVCVNCADCAANIGLKVPVAPFASDAIGDALLAPTLLPIFPTQQRLFPTVQPPQSFELAAADMLQTLRPTLSPQPGELSTQSPVPQTCTPLPTGQAFQHPFNPCQTCICQTTLRDVQITCIENAQCVLPTENISLAQLPHTSEPIPSARCLNMPFNVPFPHPTDHCKRCQCVEQVSAFKIQEPQLLCVPIPDCDLSTTLLYPSRPLVTVEDTIITEPNAFDSDNFPEIAPALSTETVFMPTDLASTDITFSIPSQVPTFTPNKYVPSLIAPELPLRPYFQTPEIISADGFLTPSSPNTIPVSPDGGLIIPQKPLLPHLNPPLPREQLDSLTLGPKVVNVPAFALTDIDETIDTLPYKPLVAPTIPKDIESVDVEVILSQPISEEPLPWPPKISPTLPRKLEGPLLGPSPHKSCHPYPPNTVFQHPWDECQVCRCSEYHALGHTSVEVNCFTKASCCVREQDIKGGIPSQAKQQFESAANGDLLQSMQEVIAKDKVFYLEPKCRVRAPNKPFVVECNVCECRVIYHFVVAKCTPQPHCKERQKHLPGGNEAVLDESQSLTFSIPMNGAIRPPPETLATNLISVVAEAGDRDTLHKQNTFGTQLYQYPSVVTYTQPQLPTLTIPKYNNNFVPITNFASPQMAYYPFENEFNQQNYLLNSVDNRLTGYQYAKPTHQVPFGEQPHNGFKDHTRYLPRSYGNPNYQQWQNTYGRNYAQATANAQAVANAQAAANAEAVASAQAMASAQANLRGTQNSIFSSYGHSSPLYGNWRKDLRPGDAYSFGISGVETSSAAASASTSTNAYPASSNAYPASSSLGLFPATTTVVYDRSTQALAQAMAGAEGRPVTKRGRGQCQYAGDMYHERCQACHCLAETSSPHQLYSLCYGDPCH